MRFQSVARTHVGCRRKVNEDSFLSRPEKGLWAVADGLGGHEAGDVASALVIERLDDCSAASPLAERADAVRHALNDANARLLAMARTFGAARTIGSTVVAIMADAEAFVCFWAGDSRAYLARNGNLIQLTRDHSLVQELVDAGEIAPADANRHPNANVITRAVGSTAELDTESMSGIIEAGDTFLLSSDGLTRLVNDREILDALQAQDLEREAGRLVDLCLARGAPDNVTLVILRACPN